MKNLILILTIVFFTGLLFSCEDDLEKYEPQPEPQKVEAIVYYSGFVDHPLAGYDLYILIWNEEGEEIINKRIESFQELLREGATTYLGKLSPGKYTAYAWWDIGDDGLWHEYDPESEIVEFTVDGFNKASFNLYLKDKVTSSEGWIEFTIISYRTYYGPVYLKINSTQGFYKEIKLELDFGSWYEHDYLLDDLEEAFYGIEYFMDLNSNGVQDSNEPNGGLGKWVYSAVPTRIEIIFE
jgi:hypothetical protein